MIHCGIDLGSRQVKLVLMEQGAIQELKRYNTIDFYRLCVRGESGRITIDFGALDLPHPESVVATGYGRYTVGLADCTVISELRAHARGAVWQTGLQDFTLLDLGGQDSKVIQINRGKMADFQTNDKCAASSGRYLENMAAVLGVSWEELFQYDSDPVELSSTCAVFGESELIGRIVEGYSVPQLCAGVNYTIFKRLRPFLSGITGDLVFTGGVAYNAALGRILERELGVRVIVPPYPEYNGAIGCATHAT